MGTFGVIFSDFPSLMKVLLVLSGPSDHIFRYLLVLDTFVQFWVVWSYFQEKIGLLKPTCLAAASLLGVRPGDGVLLALPALFVAPGTVRAGGVTEVMQDDSE